MTDFEQFEKFMESLAEILDEELKKDDKSKHQLQADVCEELAKEVVRMREALLRGGLSEHLADWFIKQIAMKGLQ